MPRLDTSSAYATLFHEQAQQGGEDVESTAIADGDNVFVDRLWGIEQKTGQKSGPSSAFVYGYIDMDDASTPLEHFWLRQAGQNPRP